MCSPYMGGMSVKDKTFNQQKDLSLLTFLAFDWLCLPALPPVSFLSSSGSEAPLSLAGQWRAHFLEPPAPACETSVPWTASPGSTGSRPCWSSKKPFHGTRPRLHCGNGQP